MIILREKNFSKKKSDDNRPKTRNAAGLYGGLMVANTGLALPTILKPGKVSKEESKITGKLVNSGMKRGIKVVDYGAGIPGPAYYEGTVYRNHSKSPAMIAHELGHAHYDTNKATGKVGKYAHKIYLGTGGSNSPLPRIAAIGTGIAAGRQKFNAEKEGKKENKILRHASYLAPTAVSAPMLISEGAASLKGLQLMKQAGANRAMRMKGAGKLGMAFGTYATMVGANAATGEIARRLTYKALKNKEENKKKNKR